MDHHSINFPPFLYLALRDLGEECDDMNKVNGDGCSLFCRQELSFNCIGKCLWHGMAGGITILATNQLWGWGGEFILLVWIC